MLTSIRAKGKQGVEPRDLYRQMHITAKVGRQGHMNWSKRQWSSPHQWGGSIHRHRIPFSRVILVTRVTDGTRDSVTGGFCHGVALSQCHVCHRF
jgi:hypothetical protein